ncbi:MAG: hypothetical protein ACMG6E_01670 [Candidatus Roizmanbacteria bacterium]
MQPTKNPQFLNYFKRLFVIDFLFTGIDALFHLTFESLEVYSYPIPKMFLFISSNPLLWYAVGKFGATLIIGSLLFYFVKKGKSTLVKTLILSIPVVLLMEGRYILSGYYSAGWHILNTIMHFFVLSISTYLVFWKSRPFEK